MLLLFFYFFGTQHPGFHMSINVIVICTGVIVNIKIKRSFAIVISIKSMNFYNYHGVKFCTLILCLFEVDQIYFTIKESFFVGVLLSRLMCVKKKRSNRSINTIIQPRFSEILRPKLHNEKSIRGI